MRLGRMRLGRKGVVSLLAAITLVPLIAAGGAAVDFSRAAAARAQLQAAVDSAALAGAGTYQSAALAQNAVAVARQTFLAGTEGLSGWITVPAPSITAVPSTDGNGQENGFKVSVSATANMANSLMAMFSPAMTIGAAAGANNPFQAATPQDFRPSASADDHNAIYIYPVPVNPATGIANYAALPSVADCEQPLNPAGVDPVAQPGTTVPSGCPYYEMGDNVLTKEGIPLPNQSPAAITTNTPIAFLLVNVTGGYIGYGQEANGCPATNEYGSPSQEGAGVVPLADSTTYLSSAYEALKQSPSFSTTNGVPAGANHAFDSTHPVQGSETVIVTTGQGRHRQQQQETLITTCEGGPAQTQNDATFYPATPYYLSGAGGFTGPAVSYPSAGNFTANATNDNCSLMIQDLTAAGKGPSLPANPPTTGRCFNPADYPNASGTFGNTNDRFENPQFGSQTCAQYGADNYAIWWNDMGGGADDLDYNDMDVVFSCTNLGIDGGTSSNEPTLTD